MRKNIFRSEKIWHGLGCGLSVLMIIVGIVFALTPPQSYRTETAENNVSFGADFYTYEYEATQIAGSNSAVTANNLREIGTAQAHYVGAAFVAVGLFSLLHFARKLFTALPESNAVQEQSVSGEIVNRNSWRV